MLDDKNSQLAIDKLRKRVLYRSNDEGLDEDAEEDVLDEKKSLSREAFHYILALVCGVAVSILIIMNMR